MRFLRYLLIAVAFSLVAFLLMPDVVSDGVRGLNISVKVIDAFSGKPIEGARVVLFSARNNENPELYPPRGRAVGSTDENGTASVTGPFPAGWGNFRGGIALEGATVKVSATGYETAVQPVSEKKEIRHWIFWSPRLSLVFKLKADRSGLKATSG